MTDYISRQAAIWLVENGSRKWGEEYGVSDVLCDLNDMQSADVVEVDKVNKIYEKLAELLDAPCNYSPCDEIMLESGRCREDCGNISDAECWKRYFEVVCDGERSEA